MPTGSKGGSGVTDSVPDPTRATAAAHQHLQVAKKVVRRLFNPLPIPEKQVAKEAEHMLWALDHYGYKVVPK